MIPRILLIFIIGILTTFSNCVQGQNKVDSLSKVNEGVTINVKDSLGSWVSTDSLKTKIEFKEDNFYVIMLPKIYVDYYRFTKKEREISVMGCAANWPPYSCIVNLINPNTLKIYFYGYDSNEATSEIYVRE